MPALLAPVLSAVGPLSAGSASEPVPADPVESFLEATGLGQFRDTFAAEEIDLVTLRDLAVDDLQFLGLNDDECRRFLAARDANF